MRRTLIAALTAAMLLALAAPALAHPQAPVGPTLPTDLTHASTDNVEYLGRFPEHAGTAGGRLSDDGQLFYVTDPRGVFIYDVADPEVPELIGSVDLYQQGTGVALAQEDPDTDGHILIVDGATSPTGSAALQVVDVSDPTSPAVVGSVGTTDHTWTCVTGEDIDGVTRGCAYAYGRSGHIIDLTDPTNPVNLPNTWREGADGMGTRGNSPYAHDLTEIRPGLVMSAGASAILMDTSDPAAPVELARIEEPGRFSSLGYHSVEWSTGEDGTLDPYVVLGTEIAPPPGTSGMSAGSDCEGDNSVIEVWDASQVVAALEDYEVDGDVAAFDDAEFVRTDSFDAGGRGIFLLGQAPGNQLYCAHWMDIHPDFDGQGYVTVSYYDRGTRFLEVDDAGKMTEIGWMVPAEGYSGSSRWISDEVVYVMDYRRGMEVLKVDTGTEATAVRHNAPDAIIIGSRYVPDSAIDLTLASTLAMGLLGLLAFGVERTRRRRLSLRG